VVQELLDYARKDKCSGETCDLNQLAQDLIETFINCRLKRYRIEIVMELCPETLVVEGGCGQLDIVLSNLLVNAIDALDKTPSPRIIVRTWRKTPMPLSPFQTTARAYRRISASGCSIPSFPPRKSAGLRAWPVLSQAIVTKRGGFIAYDAAYGEGARFVVKLPAVDLERAKL